MAFRLLAMMIILWFGFALGGNAIESLLFIRFGPRSLPPLYVALGVVTFAIMLGLNTLLGRPRPRRLLLVTPLVMAVVVVVMRLLLVINERWLYPAMWLAMMVMWTVALVAAWGIAGAVHDTRQVKRLFPLYGSGLILGVTFGGLATSPLARWLGVENLLLPWAAALGLAFLVARSALRVGGGIVPTRRRGRRPSPPPMTELARGLRSLMRSPLLSWMALSLALFALLYFSVAFLFARAATERFPDAGRLAGFLGLFMGATSGIALMASLFAANRLFARFGVAPMVLVLPLMYVAGFAVLLAGPGFGALVAFRFLQMVWVNGVWGSGWQALFNVVPAQRRDQTRAFMDGVALQGGIVASGLVLVLADRVLQPRAVAIIGVAAAGLAIFTVWRVRQAYAGAVVEALRAGNPEVFLAEEEPFGGIRQDAAALEVVARSVSDRDPAVRRISMQILAEVADGQVSPALHQGLRDDDAVVRAAALRGWARIGDKSAFAEASGLVGDPDPDVRLAAVDALVASGLPERAATHLSGLLADPDPRVRARASAALLGSDRADEADRILHAMADSPEPEWRAAAVSSLSTDPHAGAAHALVRALGDPDPFVRAEAAEGLVRMGAPARDPLVEALARPDLEAEAIHVLDRLGGVDPSILRQYVRREVSRAVSYGELLSMVGVDKDDRTNVLAHALHHRALQHAVNALHAASHFWDAAAIELAIENLNSRDPVQRANALETLDAVGEPSVVRPLLAIWEGAGHPAGDRASALAKLMRDADPWLRACAAFAAAGNAGLRSALELLAHSDADTLVRETAASALEGDRPMETLPSLSLMDRVVFLRRVSLFVDLSPADLKHVGEIVTEQAYTDGEVIAEQGEPGDEMYVVVSGEIRVLVTRPGGTLEVARRPPGEAVGEMAIISGAPRMASLVAAGEVRTLAIDRGRFERILRERPEASLAVMRVLSSRLRESHGAEPVEARA
ncbi:MAG: HEAT repeat domain-containing protein [Actinomycetota bacterium]